MKMPYLNSWIAEALVKVSQEDDQQLVKNMNEFF